MSLHDIVDVKIDANNVRASAPRREIALPDPLPGREWEIKTTSDDGPVTIQEIGKNFTLQPGDAAHFIARDGQWWLAGLSRSEGFRSGKYAKPGEYALALVDRQRTAPPDHDGGAEWANVPAERGSSMSTGDRWIRMDEPSGYGWVTTRAPAPGLNNVYWIKRASHPQHVANLANAKREAEERSREAVREPDPPPPLDPIEQLRACAREMMERGADPRDVLGTLDAELIELRALAMLGKAPGRVPRPDEFAGAVQGRKWARETLAGPPPEKPSTTVRHGRLRFDLCEWRKIGGQW